MIEDYDFGRIVIDGKTYTRDVLIFPDRVFEGWWRKEGHVVDIEDLKEVVKSKPEILVIGTGQPGRMKVKSEAREFLESGGDRGNCRGHKKGLRHFKFTWLKCRWRLSFDVLNHGP